MAMHFNSGQICKNMWHDKKTGVINARKFVALHNGLARCGRGGDKVDAAKKIGPSL